MRTTFLVAAALLLVALGIAAISRGLVMRTAALTPSRHPR
jgi:hypothetical protein